MSFSWQGFYIAAMIIMPSLLFLILPAQNMPAQSANAGVVFTICERVGQVAVLVILCFTHFGDVNLWALLMAFSLFFYYALWILRYYVSGRDYRRIYAPWLFIPVPLAVLPVLAIGFAALWTGNLWLGLADAVFAVGHLANSWAIYQQLMKQ